MTGMRAGHVLLSIALGLLLTRATPFSKAQKTVSLPLRRHFPLYESDDAEGPLPLKVNGLESLVYTVDVRVGAQSFNLTLDMQEKASVLFAKGFVASNRSCSTGDAQRNLFDRSLSKSFKVIDRDLGRSFESYLYEYPYVGLECHQLMGHAEHLFGVWGQDTYQFGALSVPEVPFILANSTYYPLNPRWASDGILPLGRLRDDAALQKILDAFGGAQEVSIFLNNARPSDNQPVPGGRITFGGKNTKDCGDKMITLRADSSGWIVNLNRVNFDYRRISEGDEAQLSTSTPFLEVPPYEFRPFVNVAGATFSNDLNLYTVDCSKVGSLPSIGISIGLGFGLAYNVTAEDYIAKIGGKNGVQCAMLVVQGGNGWVIGTQFLPKRCVHLDYAKSQVGFADPKN